MGCFYPAGHNICSEAAETISYLVRWVKVSIAVLSWKLDGCAFSLSSWDLGHCILFLQIAALLMPHRYIYEEQVLWPYLPSALTASADFVDVHRPNSHTHVYY